MIGAGRNVPSNSSPKSTKLLRPEGHRRPPSQPDVHGPAACRNGLHSPTMKKLLILVVLVALAAVAAKKVRTV